MTDNPDDDVEELARRRVPCLIAYLHPFRIVDSPDLAPWTANIEDVNQRSWDYVALHEMAGGLQVGLPTPYHLVVARDGAFALPPVDALRSDQAAVGFFNRCLASLLIGGVYCEAITPDGLDLGSILDWKYVRSHRTGTAAPNRFHQLIRYLHATPYEAISLYRPRTVAIDTLRQAMKEGLGVLDRVPVLSGEYLLKGTTGIARRDWGAALANLWIATEQLISELWARDIVKPALLGDRSKARRDQLNDTRTWTAAARAELLLQKGVIDLPTFKLISVARKARNDLSHVGKPPRQSEAQAAYDGFCGLLSFALNGERPKLFDLNLSDHALSDPFAPPRMEGQPEFWMEIPKLPGELELERAETRLRTSAGRA